LISAKNIIDDCAFSEIYRVKFYDHSGIEGAFDFSLDIFTDMAAMYGIDAMTEMWSTVRYQLEGV